MTVLGAGYDSWLRKTSLATAPTLLHPGGVSLPGYQRAKEDRGLIFPQDDWICSVVFLTTTSPLLHHGWRWRPVLHTSPEPREYSAALVAAIQRGAVQALLLEH